MAVSVEDLKGHLGITGDDDDTLLARKLAVALALVGVKVGGLEQFGDTIPAPIDEAVLMFAAHLYANREATTYGGQAYTLPLGVDDLLSPYRSGWVY